MRKLILIIMLMLGLSVMSYSQDVLKYKALNYFEGVVTTDSTIWKKNKQLVIKPIILVTNYRITVKAKNNWFEHDMLIERTFEDEYVRYVWLGHDKKGEMLFIIFLGFREGTHIYFQYEHKIWGYNIVQVE